VRKETDLSTSFENHELNRKICIPQVFIIMTNYDILWLSEMLVVQVNLMPQNNV
jgi:hypothetical protein